MNRGPSSEMFFFVLAAILVVVTLVGAVILRGAVSLSNKFIGRPKLPAPIPEPSFGKAAAIVFLSSVINFVVGFFLGMALGFAAIMAGKSEEGARAIVQSNVNLVQLVSSVIGFFVFAGLSSVMLPTTFPRGLVVALCYLLVALFVIACLGAIVFASMMVIGK